MLKCAINLVVGRVSASTESFNDTVEAELINNYRW